VIKGESREVIEGEPGGVSRIGGGGGRVLDEIDEGEVGHGHDVFAWIAIGSPDSGELLEVDVLQSGLFLEFASCAVVDVFPDSDEAAGEGPFVFEGGEGALDEEDFEVILIEAENNAIAGEGGSCVVVDEAHTPFLSVETTLIKKKV